MWYTCDLIFIAANVDILINLVMIRSDRQCKVRCENGDQVFVLYLLFLLRYRTLYYLFMWEFSIVEQLRSLRFIQRERMLSRVDFFCFIRSSRARIQVRRRSLSQFRAVYSRCLDYLSSRNSRFMPFHSSSETDFDLCVMGISILEAAMVLAIPLCVSTDCWMNELFFSSQFLSSSASFCRSACIFLHLISSWLTISIFSQSFISCQMASVVLRVLLFLSSQQCSLRRVFFSASGLGILTFSGEQLLKFLSTCHVVDLTAFFQGIVIMVEQLQSFPKVVDLNLKQPDVLGLKKVLIDCWQFFETDSVGLESYDLVDLVVQVLQLATQLTVCGLVLLDQSLLLALGDHQQYYNQTGNHKEGGEKRRERRKDALR